MRTETCKMRYISTADLSMMFLLNSYAVSLASIPIFLDVKIINYLLFSHMNLF